MIKLSLDLGIDAQQFKMMVQSHHANVEKQIQEGVEKALKELDDEKLLVDLIKEQVKKNALAAVSTYMFKYDIQHKIEEAIKEKLTKKIEAFSDKAIDAIAKQLNVDISHI